MRRRPSLARALKGGLSVSERETRIMAAGGSILMLALTVFPGCAGPRRPPTALYVDAVALRELGQNELAVNKLKAVLAVDPGFALAYTELGKAYQALADREKALAAFEQAARLAPWSLENHLNLARIRAALGQYPQAAEAFARAAELDSKSFDALKGAAECYLKAGQATKALTYGERAALPLLARVYEAQKDYGQAAGAYRRLLTVAGDDPNVLLPLGVTYMKAGQYDRAREILVSASQRRPENGEIFRHLGYCLVKLENLDQALLIYQRAVDLDSKDWEAQRGLGVVLVLKAGQTGDARLEAEGVRHWRRSLVLKPDQPKRDILEKLIREHSRLQNPLQELNY
jgi:tetratricopeptide (TPR) repeat protein